MKFAYLFLLVLIPFQGMASGEDEVYAKNLREKATSLVQRFNRELEWFFDYESDAAFSNKKYLEENQIWIPQLLQNRELEVRLGFSQRLFEQLAHSVAASVALTLESGKPNQILYARAYLDVTRMYVNFMEEMLFPQGWQRLFDKYEKDRVAQETAYLEENER